jgi:glycine hydroxymethyltransferase
VPYADVVTTTTHKTLRGPRGGLILCREEYAKAVDSAVFPYSQGGPLEHIIAAKAICFKEAMEPSFKEYIKGVLDNTGALAEELKARGFDIVTGGTDVHLVLIDLTKKGITGKDFEEKLESVGIATNKNSIPGDSRSPNVTSGIRVGAASLTTRGLTEDDMRTIAGIFADIADAYDENKDEARAKVAAICKKYPLYSDL